MNRQNDSDPQSTPTKPKLTFYERLTGCLLISFIAFLVLLNLYLDEKKLPETTAPAHYPNNPLIEVAVEGAVQYPGIYQIKKGSCVQEVLELAQPKEEANLKRFKRNTKIMRRRTIKVPS